MTMYSALPIKHGNFPVRYAKWPEGKQSQKNTRPQSIGKMLCLGAPLSDKSIPGQPCHIGLEIWMHQLFDSITGLNTYISIYFPYISLYLASSEVFLRVHLYFQSWTADISLTEQLLNLGVEIQ